MHLENLPFNYEEAVAVLLFVIGFCMLLFSRNLIKKVIGLDIMDSGVFLLLADRGYIAGRTAPIIVDGVTDMSRYDASAFAAGPLGPLPTATCRSGADGHCGLRQRVGGDAVADGADLQDVSDTGRG